jgi:hypothetical protein
MHRPRSTTHPKASLCTEVQKTTLEFNEHANIASSYQRKSKDTQKRLTGYQVYANLQRLQMKNVLLFHLNLVRDTP